VGAGIAFVALIFAILSSNANRRGVRTARDQFRRHWSEQASSESAKFIGWLTAVEPLKRSAGEGAEAYGNVWRVEIAIRNASDMPMYDIWLYCGARSPGRCLVGRINFIPPGQVAPLLFESHLVYGESGDRLGSDELLAVLFRDGRGTWWHRSDSAELISLDSRPPWELQELLQADARRLADKVAWSGNDRTKMLVVRRRTKTEPA
jgi:hypothetical protein